MVLLQFQLFDVQVIAYAAIGAIGLGLLAWDKSRRWHSERNKAWAPELAADAESFTKFQRLTEAGVLAHLTALKLPPPERSLEYRPGHQHTEAFVTLFVPSGQLNVELYPDQVNVCGAGIDSQIEQWGERSPNEARRAALAAIDRVLARAAAPTI